MGYRVYVDWIEDPSLERDNVTKDTADKIKNRMLQSSSLFYATTINASTSKWMPWELGFMDGKKDRSAILPVFSTSLASSHDYKGQEYLGIYPYCIKAVQNITNIEKLWIFESRDTYVLFDEWLNGKNHTKDKIRI